MCDCTDCERIRQQYGSIEAWRDAMKYPQEED